MLTDPTGHDAYSTCGGNTSCIDYVNHHTQLIDTTVWIQNHAEDILKKHKGTNTEWDDLTPQEQNILIQYQCGPGCWQDDPGGGSIHNAEFYMDPLFYLELIVVGGGTYKALVDLATINGGATVASIGSNGLYQKAGYTFFQLPNGLYKVLNVVGIAKLINITVITNQIAQEKPAIVSLLNPAQPGPMTEIEIKMFQAAQYIINTANWLGADKILQPSTWQW